MQRSKEDSQEEIKTYFKGYFEMIYNSPNTKKPLKS